MKLTKAEIDRLMTMSMEEIQSEYPKIGMIMDYIFKHYPDDRGAISDHPLLPPILFSDYSNPQIEGMIDKLAIMNGWKKYEAKQ